MAAEPITTAAAHTARIVALALCLLSPLASPAAEPLSVWTFDQGTRNAFHGGYNGLHRGKADVVPRLVRDTHRGAGGAALQIDYLNPADDLCGVWMHLFDTDAPVEKRNYFGTRKTPFLSFWVKGAHGGEDFDVRMANRRLALLDDSRSAGPVTTHLGGPVTTNWQEAVIPVKAFKLNSPDAAVLSWFFPPGSRGTVFIDDITFKPAADTPVPASGPTPRTVIPTPPRALWIWQSLALLTNDAAREACIAFSLAHHITDLYVQILPSCGADAPPDANCELEQPAAWETFIRACSARGLRVQALEGRPDYVLAKWHPRLLALARAVIAYNRSVEADARFSGLRFDNEPHLLPVFEGPRHDDVLLEWLEGNRKLARLVREEGDGLHIGADIPFWLDTPEHAVLFNGRKQPAAFHLIDLLDEVTLMDYRDVAGGLDGIIAQGEREVDYASQAGKHIRLGVETFKYEPTPVTFVALLPPERYQRLSEPGHALADRYQLDGFRLHTLPTSAGILVGLAHPRGSAAPTAALAELSHLVAAERTGRWLTPEVERTIAAAIRRNPEYEGRERAALTAPDGTPLDAFTTVRQMLDKVTFAEESKGELEKALLETGQAFESRPGFGGFAIHYYETYRALAE